MPIDHSSTECDPLPVVLHNYDEIIVEAAEAQADDVLRRLAEIMSMPPAWVAGFPVEVEGFAAQRYGKSSPPGAIQVKSRNGQLLQG
ncbi:MAG: hypothetical protein JNM56_27275 [Planctomycetia bacterium]|nr:hypothetical protein [Planctomycetia bacterium]